VSLEALRDEFALGALNGLLASHGADVRVTEMDLAIAAYRYADAMLIQRRAYCPVCQQKIDPAKGFIVHVSGCTFGFQEDLPTGEM
jgi:hypothetical protein